MRCCLEDSIKYIRLRYELEDPDCLSIYVDMLARRSCVPQNKRETLKYLLKMYQTWRL